MSARRGTPRIYWRDQGGQRRAYGDFRPIGGGRESLVPDGETQATTDPEVAAKLFADRIQELREEKRTAQLYEVKEAPTLEEYSATYLEKKEASKRRPVSTRHLEDLETYLRRAVDFFGPARRVATFTAADVEAWTARLEETANGRGLTCPACGKRGELPEGRWPARARCECGASWETPTLQPGSVRSHLNALSNLFRFAQADGVFPPSHANPVQAMVDKPSASRTSEAPFLEIHDAALVLEAARRLQLVRDDWSAGVDVIVATFLLTGGRSSEVLGLDVDDVSFDRKTITFRPNRWRGLKTRTSHRVVPLWPQLEEILRGWLFGGAGVRSAGLLFPGAGPEKMIRDLRKPLDRIGQAAGLEPGVVRTRIFRHTYTAARLQTVDAVRRPGADPEDADAFEYVPVSPYTVAKELGHGGTSLVKRVYGHLGNVRHRSETVEYRVEAFEEQLGERLTAVRALASAGTP